MSKRNGGKKKGRHQYGYWNGKRIRRRPWAWKKKVEEGKVGTRTSNAVLPVV
jgi:hypothetical protein